MSKFSLSLFIVIVFSCSTAKRGQSNAGKKDDLTWIDENFKDGLTQYKVLMKSLPPEKFPRTFLADSNKLITSDQVGGAVDFIREPYCICMKQLEIRKCCLKLNV